MTTTCSLAYTENDAATVVSANITVSDVDSLTDPVLDSATVTISSGMRDGDLLAYPSSVNGITAAAFNATTGMLALSGSVSLADWQAALRSVMYSSTSEDPTGTQRDSERVVSFVISDGDVSSGAVSRVVTVVPVNDAPVLAGMDTSSLAYSENDAATAVCSSITVSDVDVLTDPNMESATVTISSGLREGDVLVLPVVATPAPTPLVPRGWSITSGTACSIVSLGSGAMCVQDQSGDYGNDEHCTFEYAGSAMITRTEWSLEADSECGFDYVQVDGATKYCGASGDATAFPAMLAVNGTRFAFSSDRFNAGAGFKLCEDTMPTPAPTPSHVLGSGITSVYNASSGKLVLSGSVPVASWQFALQSVTFSSSSEDPTGTQSPSDRTVTFVISDGDASSAAVTRTITVTPVNDVPVLANVENISLAYTENDAAQAVSPKITVSDLDYITDATLAAATVTISSGLRSGDVLSYNATSDSAITAVYDASVGTLSLSGDVSVLAWQAALRLVSYSSSSEDPTGTHSASGRSVSFVISDGDSSSSVVTRTVTVTPVNDVPVLAGMEAGILCVHGE